MDLYDVMVFVHVLAAIVVVGGSFSLDFMGARTRRSRTVDSLRSWLQATAIGSKAIMYAALVTFLAGLHLAFAGEWWGEAWLTVSLLLFLVAGALAGAVMDKGVARMSEIAEGFPEGPMSPELGRRLAQPAMAVAGPAMVGIDVAIVFLMTTKPGWAATLAVTAVSVGAGVVFGLRERSHLGRPSAPPEPAIETA